ncbi:hypothetical protein BFV94_3778 [Alteromonas macleodii]|uniref:Uncharacterized protein n=1 Tax=Alteromonas macleodii TaxID=28108 RepID=A0AB36FMM4_ALTMA|nr:hypothetical protein BFV95_3783 [Alteromonas macleodii]OES27580.1 hypothetical protein BFV94_3778 [Alteromonas macleodii]OES27688.1 hypothetical protein BFV93_3773 [Alteromonas macleodii]OES39753.1 hypothetical protein BFV96_3767 [Alteromonas macleodii]
MRVDAVHSLPNLKTYHNTFRVSHFTSDCNARQGLAHGI